MLGKIAKNHTLALYLFLFLWGIYLLSFSGVPITDDEHLFISAAQNAAIQGELTAPQVYGNGRLDGNFYGIGPFHPFLASPLVLVGRVFNLGIAQVLFFLPPFYTALTAMLLFLIGRRKGYSDQASFAAALAFGLGTIAWPYAQTFFREPLAMLLLTGAWYFFEAAAEAHPPMRQWLNWGLFLALFTAAVLTKIYVVTVIPAFVLLFWLRTRQPAEPRTKKNNLLLWLGIILLAVLGLWFFQFLLPRFNTRLTFDFIVDQVWPRLQLLTPANFLLALGGILFSPAKGLLVYNPVLWLVPVAVIKKRREIRDWLWLALLCLGAFILAQSVGYRARWWGITWGTRFLLPVLPMLVMTTLPVIDSLLGGKDRRRKLLFWGLVGLSIIIQLGGVLVSDIRYLEDLYFVQGIPDAGNVIWLVGHAPVWVHWRLLLAGVTPNLAAARLFFSAPGGAFLALGSTLGVIGLGAWGLWGRWKQNRYYTWVSVLLACFLLPGLMLSAYRHEPSYLPDRQDMVEANQWLGRQAQPGDVVVVHAYLQPAWYYLMNFSQLDVPWYSLPADYPPDQLQSIRDLFAKLEEPSQRIWLFVENPRNDDFLTQAIISYAPGAQVAGQWEWISDSPPRRHVVITLLDWNK